MSQQRNTTTVAENRRIDNFVKKTIENAWNVYNNMRYEVLGQAHMHKPKEQFLIVGSIKNGRMNNFRQPIHPEKETPVFSRT